VRSLLIKSIDRTRLRNLQLGITAESAVALDACDIKPSKVGIAKRKSIATTENIPHQFKIFSAMAPRSVLITGCSQGGAGEALARVFLQNRFRVFATARSLSKIQHLESEGIDILELNVLNNQSIEEAAAAISERTGGTLDVLINNAGAGTFMLIAKLAVTLANKLQDTCRRFLMWTSPKRERYSISTSSHQSLLSKLSLHFSLTQKGPLSISALTSMPCLCHGKVSTMLPKLH
jgi:hypothetical protein